MRRFSFYIIVLLLLDLSGISYGQDSILRNNGFRPYVGASVNLSEVVRQVGFGFEVGTNYRMFYLGGEYGIYGFTIYNQSSGAGSPIIPWPGYQPPDYIVNQEQFYGFHAGVIIKNSFWFGVTFHWSKATMHHPPVDSLSLTNPGFDYPLSVFTLGTDIRFTCWDHETLDFAYSNRRGLKIGMAYVF